MSTVSLRRGFDDSDLIAVIVQVEIVSICVQVPAARPVQ